MNNPERVREELAAIAHRLMRDGLGETDRDKARANEIAHQAIMRAFEVVSFFVSGPGK